MEVMVDQRSNSKFCKSPKLEEKSTLSPAKKDLLTKFF